MGGLGDSTASNGEVIVESYDSKVLVYHYDPSERFFLYSEEACQNPRDGTPLVPKNATLVAPPVACPEGHIPVFDGETWEIMKDVFWRPQCVEINFDAGREASTWEPKAISHRDFPVYPNVFRLAASPVVVFRLVDNIRYIDAKFQHIVNFHSENLSRMQSSVIDRADGGASLCAKPTALGMYKLESEALIFQMRHCLDTLCRLTELLVDADKVNEERSFRCDFVGTLFSNKKNGQVANIIRGLGGNFEGDTTDFLRISNDLFNTMKHSHINAETQTVFSTDCPSIVALQLFNGKDKHEVTYHNHNAYHLMMGFHDSIDRILVNQKTFLAAQ